MIHAGIPFKCSKAQGFKTFPISKFKYMEAQNTWHEKHNSSLNFAQRLADKVANGMGSWSFIITQSIIVAIWMILNIIGYVHHWDPYPFILLNLLFSTQAAYAAPIIMMSQNRQSERDRLQAMEDYKTNFDAKMEIEELQRRLNEIEVQKLDKIITMLEALEIVFCFGCWFGFWRFKGGFFWLCCLVCVGGGGGGLKNSHLQWTSIIRATKTTNCQYS